MPIDIFGRTSNIEPKVSQKTSMSSDTKYFLRHDGSVSATVPLNMDGNAVRNLPFPSSKTDAANREYVDTKINNLEAKMREYIDKIVSDRLTAAIKN